MNNYLKALKEKRRKEWSVVDWFIYRFCEWFSDTGMLVLSIGSGLITIVGIFFSYTAFIAGFILFFLFIGLGILSHAITDYLDKYL